MPENEIRFTTPVATAGLPGFPDALAGVAEARRAVEVARVALVLAVAGEARDLVPATALDLAA